MVASPGQPNWKLRDREFFTAHVTVTQISPQYRIQVILWRTLRSRLDACIPVVGRFHLLVLNVLGEQVLFLVSVRAIRLVGQDDGTQPVLLEHSDARLVAAAGAVTAWRSVALWVAARLGVEVVAAETARFR